MGYTPQGFREDATAVGHITWAATSAVGALDRAAAAFGAIHLGVRPRQRVYDLAELNGRRGKLPSGHPVVTWLDAVHRDPAYVLLHLRNPLVHRTTARRIHRTLGNPEAWDKIPPHQDATSFYLPEPDGTLDTSYGRSVTVVEFLDQVTPSITKHLEAAIELVASGEAFHQDAKRRSAQSSRV
jgi:hypothetical protein